MSLTCEYLDKYQYKVVLPVNVSPVSMLLLAVMSWEYFGDGWRVATGVFFLKGCQTIFHIGPSEVELGTTHVSHCSPGISALIQIDPECFELPAGIFSVSSNLRIIIMVSS